MTQLKKTHDKFIRDLMSRQEAVRTFLRNHVLHSVAMSHQSRTGGGTVAFIATHGVLLK